jgi:hypothetical protein
MVTLPLRYLSLARRILHRDYSQIPRPPPVSLVDLLHSANQAEARARARTWLDAFSSAQVEKDDLDGLSFSRSSGPGGQVCLHRFFTVDTYTL